MKIRLGCIGLGGIFHAAHYPFYKNYDDVEVVAICDINEEKLKNPLFPENIKKYTSYEEMIKNEQLDAVDICTPNYLHAPIAIFALRHGLHVFSEKPDTFDVNLMEEMIKAEKESGKTLMVMRNNRHLEKSKFLKQFISEGKMGNIYSGRCGWIRRRGIPGKGGWFTTKAKSGGGPLIDLGVHVIDLAVYLMGNPIALSVSGSVFTKFAHSDISDSVHSSFGEKNDNGIFDVEDSAMGFIKFQNGACLQIEFSWASNIEKEKTFIELRGDKAGCNFNLYEDLTIFSEEHGVLTDINPKFTDDTTGHQQNIRHFFNVILHKEQPDYHSSEGLNVIKIINAIYKSAETGKEVIL